MEMIEWGVLDVCPQSYDAGQIKTLQLFLFLFSFFFENRL